MKSGLIALVILLMTFGADAQKMFTRDGKLTFVSDAPMEKIEATTSSGMSVWDTESGALEIQVLVKTFAFEKALMEEHFNENYLESDKYPYMRFEGTFEGDEPLDRLNGECFVSGTLKLHGVSQPLRTKTQWSREGDQLLLRVAFVTRPADFEIKIPKIVIKKIAEEVEIEGVFRFSLAGE